jgi:hypothetical protein
MGITSPVRAAARAWRVEVFPQPFWAEIRQIFDKSSAADDMPRKLFITAFI